MDRDLIAGLIREVPDFPEPGIVFKDITPLLADPVGLSATVDALTEPFTGVEVTAVAGVEARGFLFACGVAERLGVGMVPVRKPGKLPARTVAVTYDLEYGTDTVEMHVDACGPGDSVLVVDDVLATGGTAAAAAKLIASAGATVAGFSFLGELGFLDGRARLGEHRVEAVLPW